ncbi:outer membrane beta-barrel protein [Massilia sp. CF038]|uniref:outer membrane beta-barrel protein n=1 Tax=Massilia sp. CF038 TaxID=1881045 RepID=UPI0009124861|nr:outer membrane beta-barrel protein [Massilia sp. CF038]SHH39094.1 Opacity protein [Massilia sp. CF038]
MFKKIAFAAALAALSSAAMAADQPYFYAGGDLGRSDFQSYRSETSFGGFVGYQINSTFGVEAGYRRLAHVSDGEYDAKLNQTALSGTASMPLNDAVTVYGRLGYARVSQKVSSGPYSAKGSDSGALFGVGFSYAITPAVAARIEVQRLPDETTNLSTGIAFRF